jgi:enterochelin esterase family protein
VLQSVVEGPRAPAQPWLAPRDGVPAGEVIQLDAPTGRRVWLYDPPGVGPDQKLPLVVVLDGEVWVGAQTLPRTLDNLAADGIGPTRAVFVDSGGRESRWGDLSADGSGAAEIVDGLVPWVRAQRGVVAGPEGVIVVGQSLGGLTALRIGLTRDDAVGVVVSHSASLWQDSLLDLDPTGSPRIWLAHGSQEWVLDPPHRALDARLAELGIEHEVSIHNGGHDYAWWRGGVAEGLAWALDGVW